MGAKPIPLETYIEELQHSVVVAMHNFDIWWMYKRDRARYVGVLNSYPAFFQTSLHAHFVALVVTLYRIYETRTDTFNITDVMKRVESEKLLSPRKLAALKRRVENARKLWVKVSILRNEAFGHRTKSQPVAGVFKKANTTANQLRSLVQKTKDIVNMFSHELYRNTHAFNLRATSDTKRVLQDLKGLKNAL